jgi:predicted site-specific integrase-resolvase
VSVLPTFLPFEEAAQKHSISPKVLTQLIETGKVEAARLPSGEIVVSDADLAKAKTKAQIIQEKFADLDGQPIRLSDAARKYQISTANLARWAKAGHIRVLKQTPHNTELSEADVAYCASVYHERRQQGSTFGSRLFDEDGRPYYLKHPALAAQRRKQR